MAERKPLIRLRSQPIVYRAPPPATASALKAMKRSARGQATHTGRCGRGYVTCARATKAVIATRPTSTGPCSQGANT